jgi:F0F1-type ATP synthase membrane subunit b/b'
MFALAFSESSVQLVPDGTILVHIALILLMIWVLNRTFFRPINKVIESRERSKGGYATEAEAILAKVDEKNALYEKELLEARSDGYRLIEAERNAALVEKQATIVNVRDEVGKMSATEKASIAQQTDAALKTISTEAEQLAAKISSNLLRP